MQIDADERTAHLSVRELASFRVAAPGDTRGGGRWRAAVGQRWHRTCMEEAAAEYGAAAAFEAAIDATRVHHGWRVRLQGRIDQLIERDDAVLAREIKTVDFPLPAAAEDLLARYPAHFAQAAIYRRLLADASPADRPPRGGLLLIDIGSGLRQEVEIGPGHDALLDQQLDRLLPFLEDRRRSALRLSGLRIDPPFTLPRAGQAETEDVLERLLQPSERVLLEAPTGFGKTGIVLHQALQRLAGGVFDRVVYLTGKSTGQLEVIRQLRRMTGESVRFIQMRNRAEHAIRAPLHACTGDERCNEGIEQRWEAAGLDAPALFRAGTVALEAARATGTATGVCPYAISRACLPYAECWIGDFNYLFAPASRAVFVEQPGFSARRTLLVVDEAHNLPDRAAAALGSAAERHEADNAAAELRTVAGASAGLKAAAAEWSDLLDGLDPAPRLAPQQLYRALDLCEELARRLREERLDWDALSREAAATLWSIPAIAERLADEGDEWLFRVPRRGRLELTCLDASAWIGECLEPFGSVLLMSATLEPFDGFAGSCGLDPQSCRVVRAEAPWRDGAFDAAVDLRTDTRLKARSANHPGVARAIAALAQARGSGPVAVFFSSYRYAEAVGEYLRVLAPALRLRMQPRGADLPAQEAFLDEALRDCDVLLLILGSSYAEAIDHLGGRVDRAAVVGPALPEANDVQQARRERTGAGDAAFETTYIVPGMRKIRQAIGRLVRAPGHRARVLLIGRRFGETAYRRLLEADLPQLREIRDERQLLDWIAGE